ncbi:DUF397 domain-containing protein [Actinomadura scrupuli]|uniref:DUF397 domain-containing protein n=1 Tax=Actinomadura scrupuli TaxID=559629 RepID=UPI003D98E0E5
MISHGEPGESPWRKSSKSDNNPAGCVSLALIGGSIFIRDSKDADNKMIELSRSVLRDFIVATKAGNFDLRRE